MVNNKRSLIYIAFTNILYEYIKNDKYYVYI